MSESWFQNLKKKSNFFTIFEKRYLRIYFIENRGVKNFWKLGNCTKFLTFTKSLFIENCNFGSNLKFCDFGSKMGIWFIDYNGKRIFYEKLRFTAFTKINTYTKKMRPIRNVLVTLRGCSVTLKIAKKPNLITLSPLFLNPEGLSK